MHFNHRIAVRLAALLLIVWLVAPAARGNGPSNTEPDTLLPLVLDQGLKKFGEVYAEVDKAQAYDDKVRQGLAPIREQFAAGELDKIVPRDLENVWRAIVKLDQVGYHLRFWGEDLGADIGFRVQAYTQEVTDIVKAMYADEQTRRKVEAGMQAAERTLERQVRELPAIARWRREKDYRRAGHLLTQIREPVEAAGVWWLGDGSYQRRLTPFKEEFRKFYDEWVAAWQGAAQEASTAAAAQLAPDVAALDRQMQEAATSLATLNQVDFAGQQVTGPQAVGLIGAAWLRQQRQLLQLRSVAQLNYQHRGDMKVDQIDEQIEQLQQTTLTGIERILAADGRRALPNEAEPLYHDYLEQFAKFVPLADDELLRERFAPGLQQLIDRSPTLKMRVEAYRAATDDLLRWKARAAQQQAEARQADYPPLPTAVAAAAGGTRQEPVFVSERAATPEDARFRGPLPAAVRIASERLLEQPVRLTDVVNLGGNSSLGVGPYEHRTVGYLKASARDVAAQVEQLKADLLVTEGVRPASWEAAVALHTAENGDFEEAGGAVSRLGVIGWGGFHATTPDNQRGAVRLTPLDDPVDRGSDNVVIRLIVDPHWVRHRYFFHTWPNGGEL